MMTALKTFKTFVTKYVCCKSIEVFLNAAGCTTFCHCRPQHYIYLYKGQPPTCTTHTYCYD